MRPPRLPSTAARTSRPRSAGPAARLYRCSASSVSRRSRSQPLLGKYRSIMSRHSATGSRYDASSLHDTGGALRPAALLPKTVPENITTIGISPSSSECMYFAAAISKSYVQVIGRSTSVVPGEAADGHG